MSGNPPKGEHHGFCSFFFFWTIANDNISTFAAKPRDNSFKAGVMTCNVKEKEIFKLFFLSSQQYDI